MTSVADIRHPAFIFVYITSVADIRLVVVVVVMVVVVVVFVVGGGGGGLLVCLFVCLFVCFCLVVSCARGCWTRTLYIQRCQLRQHTRSRFKLKPTVRSKSELNHLRIPNTVW